MAPQHLRHPREFPDSLGSGISPSPCFSPAFPEQLQVHLTLLLCPALGDHKHSSRVGRVLGVPFCLPLETAPTRTQVRGQGDARWGIQHSPQ